MKYQQVRDAIDRIENARMDLDAGTKSLRALGVTDLPGDAPIPLATPTPAMREPAPGNLPGEPTEEMVMAAVDAACDLRQPVDLDIMRASLRAALAAAPRVEAEIPKVTREEAETVAMAYYHAPNLDTITPGQVREMHRALDEFRARLIARMGAKP